MKFDRFAGRHSDTEHREVPDHIFDMITENEGKWCADVAWDDLHKGVASGTHWIVETHRHALGALANLPSPATHMLGLELAAIGGWATTRPDPAMKQYIADYLKHLAAMHAGEVREVVGWWTWREGPVPTPETHPALFHAQWARTPAEFKQYNQSGKGKGKGRPYAPTRDEQGYVTKILWVGRGEGFWIREAKVVTLPKLFLAFGSRASAADLYAYYLRCRTYALTRQHAWTKPKPKA